VNPLRPRSTLAGALLALAAACLLTGSIVPVPAHPPAALPSGVPDVGTLPTQASGVANAGKGLLDLAQRIAQTGGPSEALAAAGVLPAPQAGPAGARSADLATALARLDPASASSDAFAGLDPAQAQALVPLVDAVADAAALVDQSFARLTPEQRALVLGHLLDPAATADADQAEAARLQALVDPVPMAQAAQGILAAAEAFLATQPPAPAAAAASAAAAPAGPLAPAGPGGSSVCPAYTPGSSLISPGGVVEVGLTGSNSYLQQRLLIVDLGGDDCYDNNPAAVGPGSPFPVGVIVDVGGDDLYYTDADFPSPGNPGTTWSAGVGIGGIGLIVDRWGNDRYVASLGNDLPDCAAYPGGIDSWQRLYAQGVGILGVGGIADLGGDDRYFASSTTSLPDTACTRTHAYAYAQGNGARLGVGFLLDSTGNDLYRTSADASETWVSSAHAHGQGTAARRGIGALIDEEGNDFYGTTSSASLTPGFQGGATAYTWAQASLYGTNEPRGEGVTPPDCKELGIDCQCPITTLCQIQCNEPAVCDLLDVSHVALGPGGTVAADLCAATSLSINVLPGTLPPVTLSEPCDLPALALLVDVVGQDRYSASSSSTDGGLGCDEAVWAGTAAQGSAPAKGAALLADADADTSNGFSATATASATGCGAYGVRALTSSQGFGGAFLWDIYDAPPFDPLLVTDLSVGLLASGGACSKDLDFSGPLATVALNVDTDNPCDGPQRWASDSYDADANANNPAPSGLAWAQTRAQGSGNGDLGTFPSPSVPGGPYQALGLGGLLDLFGDDEHRATADATAPAGSAQPFTVAQGAGTSGAGVLVDIGGADDYYAMSFLNGPAVLPAYAQASQWSLPYVLAQADATVPAPVILVTVGIAFAGVNDAAGILVDVFGGASDTYSLSPYCPNNGAFPLFPYFWGNQNVVTENLDLGPSGALACAPPAINYDNNAPGSPGPGTAGLAFGLDW